jgi:hypothetical protein
MGDPRRAGIAQSGGRYWLVSPEGARIEEVTWDGRVFRDAMGEVVDIEHDARPAVSNLAQLRDAYVRGDLSTEDFLDAVKDVEP